MLVYNYRPIWKVLGDSETSPKTMEKPYNRPEIIQALKNEVGLVRDTVRL